MIVSMRNTAAVQTPSLFPSESVLSSPEPVLEEPEKKTTDAARLAREFVAWCCSFGKNFRNSPDVTNLRYWLQKNGLKTSEIDESEFLLEARRLLLKRIQQSLTQ